MQLDTQTLLPQQARPLDPLAPQFQVPMHPVNRRRFELIRQRIAMNQQRLDEWNLTPRQQQRIQAEIDADREQIRVVAERAYRDAVRRVQRPDDQSTIENVGAQTARGAVETSSLIGHLAALNAQESFYVPELERTFNDLVTLGGGSPRTTEERRIGAMLDVARSMEATSEWTRQTFAVDPEFENSTAGIVFNALGSTLPFLVLGGAGAAVAGPVGAGVTSGVAGAWATEGEAMRETIAHGGTYEQIQENREWAALLGLTEGVAIVRVLRVFRRVGPAETGRIVGRFTRSMRTAGEGAGTEAVQEIFQNTGMNLIMVESGVDPDRDLFAGTEEAAIGGAGAGGIIGAIMGLVAPRSPNRAQVPPQELQEFLDALDAELAQPTDGAAVQEAVDALTPGQPVADPTTPPPETAPRLVAPEPVAGEPGPADVDAPAASAHPPQAAPQQVPAQPEAAAVETPAVEADPGQRQAQEIEELRDVLADDRPAAEIQEDRETRGTATNPIEAESAADVDAAAERAQPPTPAQAEAGNYQMGHVRVHGLDISIETPRGGTRSGVGADGRPWSVEMPAHYGYIRRSEGADGDQVDVYVGPNPQSDRIYVVDQVDANTRAFDEHKVMLGFDSVGQATQAFNQAFNDGRGSQRWGAATPMTVAEFRQWLANGDQTRALAYREPVSRAEGEAAALAMAPEQSPSGIPDLPERVGVTELGDRFSGLLTAQHRRRAAREYGRDHVRGTYRNEHTGWEIDVAKGGLEKATSGKYGAAHLEVVPALPDLLRTAVLVESRPSGRTEDVHAIHRFYAAARHQGRLYRVKITVREVERGKLFYDHHLTEVDSTATITGVATPQADASPDPSMAGSTVDVDSLMSGVKLDDGETYRPRRGQPSRDDGGGRGSGGGGSLALQAPTQLRGEVPRPAGGVATTPQNKDEAAANVRNLIERLEHALKVVARRKGHITMRKALGTFDPKTGVIRQKNMADDAVAAHEIGHHAEELYGDPLRALMQRHRGELEPLDYVPNRRSKAVALKEGFAEWFRLLTRNPAYVRNEAPKFTKAFEQFLKDKDPEVLAEIEAIQQALEQWRNAPSGAVIKADIVSTDRARGLGKVWEFMKGESRIDRVSFWAHQLYTRIFAHTHPIWMAQRRLLDIYERNFGSRLQLEMADDPAVLARLSADAQGAAHVDIMNGVVDFKTLKPEGPSLAGAINLALGTRRWTEDAIRTFASYLYSRRAVHLWDRFDAGNLPREPSRFSKAEHELNIQELEQQHPQYSQAADQVYEWTNNLWRKKRDAGLIHESDYRQGLEDNPDYVPFFRDVHEGEPERQGRPIAPGAGPTGKFGVARSIKGSMRSVINPLESLIQDAWMTERTIARNEVRKKLWKLGRQAGFGSGAIIEELPDVERESFTVTLDQVTMELQKRSKLLAVGGSPRDAMALNAAAQSLDGLDTESFRFFRTGKLENERGEPIVYVWERGKRHVLRLGDDQFARELYEALTNLERDSGNLLITLMGLPAVWLRTGVVMTPAFAVTNFIRGELTAWVLEGYIPGYHLARGFRSRVRAGETHQRYIAGGGSTGGQLTAALHTKSGNEAIAALKKRGFLLRHASVRGLLKSFAELSEISETAMREGVAGKTFREARARGLTEKQATIEAAFRGRDITDFGLHGSKMLAARRLVTFMNPALQGLSRSVQAVGPAAKDLTKAGPLRRLLTPAMKKTVGRNLSPREQRELSRSYTSLLKVSLIGMIGLALTHLYRDDPEYQELSNYLRGTHWAFRDWDGRWVVVPKPFELAIVSAMFERGYERFYFDDSRAWNRLASDLEALLVPPLLPTLAVPPLEHWGNRRFYNGMPVIPRGLEHYDPERQFTAYTSSFARWMGNQIGVAPILVDHYLTGYFGTMARDVLALTTGADPQAPERGLPDAYFTSRFVREWTRSAVSTGRFWEDMSRSGGRLITALSGFRDDHDAFRDTGDRQALGNAVAYVDGMEEDRRIFAVWMTTGRNRHRGDYTERRWHPMHHAYENQTEIRRIREDVRDTQGLTPQQKRQLDDLLSARVIALYRNAMITIGAEGYGRRTMIDVDQNLRQIRQISSQVASDLEGQVADLPSPQAVYDFYPDLQRQAIDRLDDLRRELRP